MRMAPRETHALTEELARRYIRPVKSEKVFQFQPPLRPPLQPLFRQARPLGGLSAGARSRAARAQAMLRAIGEAGYSDTRARRAVVRALCGASSGATPAELLSRGRSIHARLGQVTVYRTLDILSTLGLVQRIHGEDGCSTYAAATHGHGHYVICQRCSRAAEFEGCAAEAAFGDAAAQTGYRVSGHWLELFGLCPDCQRKGRGTA